MNKFFQPFSLQGKTILVTGASSGIGRETSIVCAGLGASVIPLGRNIERLNQTISALPPNNHRIICQDLTEEKGIEKIVEAIERIDGLVLCAGKGLTLPVQFSDSKHFKDIFEINLFASIELLRLLFKKKKISNGGSVVGIASMAGTKIFSGCNSIYGASKAALDSFTKFAAKEFAPRKIRVNSVCPGMVDTPLIHRGTISEEQLKEDEKNYPLKRYGTPEDIAYLVSFLLSEASTWITGTSINIDGGLSLK